jgi:hypothetical protein
LEGSLLDCDESPGDDKASLSPLLKRALTWQGSALSLISRNTEIQAAIAYEKKIRFNQNSVPCLNINVMKGI